VARIHYRGGVQKTLRGLRFEGDAVPGAQLVLDDRPAGVASSVVVSPTLGRRIGLAILHKRAAEMGTRLIVEGGMSAEVVPLPFVPAS
jgi:glycine cleavage system aminomethyltransferase T